MTHLVLWVRLVTISAFLTTSIAFDFLSGGIFPCFGVIHRDQLHIHFGISLEQEGASVNKPPVPCLILDEVTNQLLKLYFKVTFNKLGDAADIPSRLGQILLTTAFDCVKISHFFGVYDEFANLIDLGSRGVGVV